MRETRWTLLREAAGGDPAAREAFGRHYLPVVRAYLAARWRSRPLLSDVDDAAQEVFLRCFHSGGVLERAEPGHPGGFRAYLFGAIRKVALEFEARAGRSAGLRPTTPPELDELPGHEERLTLVFDRAYAGQVMREARDLLDSRAGDAAARQRFELLRLRFEQGLAIREIASRWNEDAARLHHDYAKARAEFKDALFDVVASHDPTRSQAEVEAAVQELFGAVS